MARQRRRTSTDWACACYELRVEDTEELSYPDSSMPRLLHKKAKGCGEKN